MAAYVLALAPILQGVPTTESAGPAWVHLALLPAGLAALLGQHPRAFLVRHWILVGFAGLAFWLSTWQPDGFEARRSALVLSSSAVAFLAGTALDAQGRQRVIRSLAWLPWALLAAVVWHSLGSDSSMRIGLGTPAGNRSDLAEFAWPGMVCALATFLTESHRTKALAAGSGALLVAILFGAGPVYAGAFALGSTAAVVLMVGWRSAQASRFGRVLLIATAVSALAVAARTGYLHLASETPGEAVAEASADREQGLAVRFEIWRTAWGMALDQSPGPGAGPGQFAREYPRYRSPREREMSSHEGRVQNPVVVEHAHHDGLNVLIEWGFWGAAGAAALAWLILTSALGALRRGESEWLVPAGVWIGFLAWGIWNAPLTAPVLAHGLAWVFAGMLTRPDFARGHASALRYPIYRRLSGRVIGPCAILLLAGFQVPRAIEFARHGFALAGASLDPNDRAGERAIRRGLTVQPDSPFALDLWAHYGSGLKDSQLQAFDRLTQIRPYQRGTWNDWGVRLARLGRFDEAVAKFEAAIEVDPSFAPALRNRVSALEDQGNQSDLKPALAEATERGAFDSARLLPRAQFLLSQGMPELAAVYAQLHNPELDLTDPDLCYAQSQAAKAAEEASAERAYRIGAQQGFARDHAQQEDWEAAVRSYRQAQRLAREANERGQVPLALRLEMAAALARTGRLEAARDDLRGLRWSGLSARMRNHAPEWAAKTLKSLMVP